MPEEAPAQPEQAKPVDLEALAEKVYKLMLQDARVLQARGQRISKTGSLKRG